MVVLTKQNIVKYGECCRFTYKKKIHHECADNTSSTNDKGSTQSHIFDGYLTVYVKVCIACPGYW